METSTTNHGDTIVMPIMETPTMTGAGATTETMETITDMEIISHTAAMVIGDMMATTETGATTGIMMTTMVTGVMDTTETGATI